MFNNFLRNFSINCQNNQNNLIGFKAGNRGGISDETNGVIFSGILVKISPKLHEELRVRSPGRTPKILQDF